MISLRLPAALTISSFALASALVIPRVGYAEPAGETLTKVIHFADLDLNSRAGVEALYRRIQSAAGDVCGLREHPGSRIPSAAWQTCMTNAVKTAVHEVDRPLLSAYYEERDGHAGHRSWLLSTASN